MKVIPVFLISLAGETERQAAAQEHFSKLGIAFSLVPGIDARRLSAAELELYAPNSALNYYRPLWPGEIGCSASHLAALKLIADRNFDYACVLEDDARTDEAILRFLVASELDKLPSFDVLRLSSTARAKQRLILPHQNIESVSVLTVFRPHASSIGQIYSRLGAQKILAEMPVVRAPFDDALYRENHVRGLRMMETRPSLVISSIQSESLIGARLHPLDRSLSGWFRKEWWKRRREIRAVINFVRAWGVNGLLRLRLGFPP